MRKLIRVVVGLYVAGHGAQKLFGWFGGPGLDATVDIMGGATGLRPARLWVPFISATEVVGGLLMAIGFLGPLGPASATGCSQATRKRVSDSGWISPVSLQPFARRGGWYGVESEM
jgi:hypothetical protein